MDRDEYVSLLEEDTAAGEQAVAQNAPDESPDVSAVALKLDERYRLSAVHMHQIIYHMRHMIGVMSTSIQGQEIYVLYEPREASARQVKNYLCAAVHAFGSQWREAMRAARARRLDRIEDGGAGRGA